MGMYTEVHFRGEIEERNNGKLINWLSAVVDGQSVEPFEDHPFFDTDRWRSVFAGSSAYFATRGSKLGIREWGSSTAFELFVSSSLKNYDDEAEKFFDWINQYITGFRGGDFIGYSRYEEDPSPRLYFYSDGKSDD
ncbi:hypothetical protein 7S3_52 [uncultured Caudovirales phage]|uniref:Uncharacterized protein n=1 Tax=uncultured Caudovirales phage TaxID=2100421 RepID=A0A2H4J2B3_9CAUD|nr:hypothetical protein 7S3_52 [uncultured Caudovirales phage]